MLEEFFPRKAHGIRPGSERLEALLGSRDTGRALRQRCILIVGTNGKGTCARTLEHLLGSAGFRVGTYTSPHFIDPLERIRIEGEKAHPDRVAAARDRVMELVTERLPDASFFEITTAIALLCFQAHDLDLLIVEAGLGGRFDSTNALSPLLTLLVSVGYDHMDRLGPTLESIAFDKACASRRGHVLLCADLPAEARLGVAAACKLTGAQTLWSEFDPDTLSRPPRRQCAELVCRSLAPLRASLLADEAPSLAAKLDTLLERPRSKLQQELESLPLPGRFDKRSWEGKALILDNAHNPHATQALLQQWEASELEGQSYSLIYGSLRTKDYRKSFELLAARAASVAIVSFSHEDSLDENEAMPLVDSLGERGVTATFLDLSDLEPWLRGSRCPPERPVLVTGSFALVGEVMKELHLTP